jgi:hypothetical protein
MNGELGITQGKLDSNKRTARTVGILFLIAMVTSLGGGIWLESIINASDYLTTISIDKISVLIGVFLELINCVAVIGIAVLLFPILKKQNEAMALGYVGIRIVEAVILVAAAVSPMLLIKLSQEFLAAGAAEASAIQSLGSVVIETRAQLAGLLTPIFFGLGALSLYYMLYKSGLVPRFISIWGFIAVVLMLVWNLLTVFGITITAGMVFVLPMILNEIYLGIHLIVKGFSPSSVTSAST